MIMSEQKGSDLPGIDGPGVSKSRIGDVDSAAEQYVIERDAWCNLSPKVKVAKDALIAQLHAHAKEIGTDSKGVIRYAYDDFVITLSPGKEKLKVKSVDADEVTDEDDADE